MLAIDGRAVQGVELDRAARRDTVDRPLHFVVRDLRAAVAQVVTTRRERRDQGLLAECLPADDDHPVGLAREHAAAESGAVRRELGGCDPRCEIERAPVLGDRVEAVIPSGADSAERLMAADEPLAHELLLHDPLRADDITGEPEFPRPGERAFRRRAMAIDRRAGPHRVLVHLDRAEGVAVDHRPKSAVADRQRFGPLLCGSLVPEDQSRGRRVRARRGPSWQAASGKHEIGLARGGRDRCGERLGATRVDRTGIVAFNHLPRAGERDRAIGAGEQRRAVPDPAVAARVVDAHRDHCPPARLDERRGHRVGAVGLPGGRGLRRHGTGRADLDAVEEGLVRVVDAAQAQFEIGLAPTDGNLDREQAPREAVVPAQPLRIGVVPAARHGKDRGRRGGGAARKDRGEETREARRTRRHGVELREADRRNHRPRRRRGRVPNRPRRTLGSPRPRAVDATLPVHSSFRATTAASEVAARSTARSTT